jgi:hypothetical protein
MSSRIMREFLALGNNNQNNDKMEIDVSEKKEKFLENNQTSLSHQKSILIPFKKQNLHNNFSKKSIPINNQENNDIYYEYLRNTSEKQDKVKKELIVESNNTSSPFSNKIDKYFIREKYEQNLEKNKKLNNQRKKNTNNENIKQKNLMDFFTKV